MRGGEWRERGEGRKEANRADEWQEVARKGKRSDEIRKATRKDERRQWRGHKEMIKGDRKGKKQ